MNPAHVTFACVWRVNRALARSNKVIVIDNIHGFQGKSEFKLVSNLLVEIYSS